MELGQLFPIEGGWNANATKGAMERDRAKKAEMDLMDLVQQMQLRQSKEGRDVDMHPLNMQKARGDIAHTEVQTQQARHKLGLDQIYGAREREAKLAGDEATTAKTRSETEDNAVGNFLSQAAQIVELHGSATPDQLVGAAKRAGLPPEHPVVQAAIRTDPAKQKQAFGRAGLQTPKIQGQLANTRLQGENQMNVERERSARQERIAAMRIQGQLAAARLRGADAKTIEHRMLQVMDAAKKTSDEAQLAQLDGEYRELERLLITKQPANVQQPQPTVQQSPGQPAQIVTPPGPQPQGIPRAIQPGTPLQPAEMDPALQSHQPAPPPPGQAPRRIKF